MASTASLVEFLVGQLGPDVSAKKMFGEYGVYRRDVLIGLICDDTLFIKPTDAGRDVIGDVKFGPPYPGAKPAFVVPEDKWDDADFMSALATKTAAALPAKKTKTSSPRKKSVAKLASKKMSRKP